MKARDNRRRPRRKMDSWRGNQRCIHLWHFEPWQLALVKACTNIRHDILRAFCLGNRRGKSVVAAWVAAYERSKMDSPDTLDTPNSGLS